MTTQGQCDYEGCDHDADWTITERGHSTRLCDEHYGPLLLPSPGGDEGETPPAVTR